MNNLTLSANEIASMLAGAGFVTITAEETFIGLGMVVLAVVIKITLGVLAKQGIDVQSHPRG